VKHFLVLFLGHLNSQTSSKYCLRDGEAHHAQLAIIPLGTARI
jgi:hypothetical protein